MTKTQLLFPFNVMITLKKFAKMGRTISSPGTIIHKTRTFDKVLKERKKYYELVYFTIMYDLIFPISLHVL